MIIMIIVSKVFKLGLKVIIAIKSYNGMLKAVDMGDSNYAELSKKYAAAQGCYQ